MCNNLKDGGTHCRLRRCGINLTKKPKKDKEKFRRGHWHDESREHIFVTSDNFLNHLKL